LAGRQQHWLLSTPRRQVHHRRHPAAEAGGIVNLDHNDLRWAYLCATEVLNTRRLRGQPIPQELRDYHDELESDWAAGSVGGPKTCQAANTNPNLDSEEAAMFMKCTPRHACRMAQKDPSLGRKVSGVWVFDRAAVENYARTRKAS
jgi:hypothetical protein